MAKRKTLTGVILCLAVLCCSLFVLATTATAAETYVLSDEQGGEITYASEYEFGYTLELKPARFVRGEDKYPATIAVRYPNGATKRVTAVSLEQIGTYTITYSAKIVGVTHKNTFSFRVLRPAYEIDGNGSVTVGAVREEYAQDLPDALGVNVSLSSGATFRYNKVLNVRDHRETKSTSVDKPIVKFYCTPEEKNRTGSEAYRIFVRLTDLHDPDNWIEVRYNQLSENAIRNPHFSYTNARANGQTAIGLENKAAKTDPTYIMFEGTNRQIHRNSIFGLNANATRSGCIDYVASNGEIRKLKNSFAENYFLFGYDDVDKKCRAHTDIVGTANLINDLDAPELYPSDPWDGFTTGEVLLSMYAESYTAPSFNFFITEIFGNREEDLLQTGVDNEIAPELSVDFGDLDKDDLQAVKGVPFPLPTATATDEFGASIKVQTRVYTNYLSEAAYRVNVVNGAFTPTKDVVYTVVYTATDALGNETVQAYDLTVIERDRLHLVFENDNQVSATVGQKVQLRNASIEGAIAGGKVAMTAKHAKETVKIDPEENAFTPLYAGEYTIEYIYSDYAGGETFTDTLTVAGSDTPAILQKIRLPRYFVKGATYSMPEVTGYDFSDDSKEVKATLYVKEGAAAERAVDGNSYKVESANGVNVVVRYGITGKSGKTCSSDAVTIPVVDTGYKVTNGLKLKEYLQGDAFTKVDTEGEKKAQYIDYTTDASKAASGTAKLELVNYGHVNFFGAEFSVPQGKANFDAVTFILTSIDNEDDVVTVTIAKRNAGSFITVTRGDETVAEGMSMLAFGADDTFKIAFSDGVLAFEGSQLYVNKNELFAGMTFFTLDIELGGITGESTLRLTKLMNQNMRGALTRDVVRAESIFETYNGKCVYGEDIVVSSVYAYDFVDPDPKVTCTVKVNGAAATSKEGVTLDGTQSNARAYTLSGNMYGTYEISIEADDGGIPGTTRLNKTIADEQPPAVTVGAHASTAKAGATVKVASLQVSDNLTATENIKVMTVVVRPDGKFVVVSDGGFTASQEGVYRVMYRVMDDAGNVTFTEYTVTVGK